MPAKDGADDKGRAGPRNQEGAGFGASERVMIIREVGGGFGFGGCGVRVGCGAVVRDGFRVDLVENHDGDWLVDPGRESVTILGLGQSPPPRD